MNARNLLVSMFAVTLFACSALGAGFSPPRGSIAPPITLKDLGGETVSTAKLSGKTLILIFGELNHEGARHACADVLDAVGDPRLTGESVVPILIIAHDAPAAQLKDESGEGRFPAVILHDPKREAFGAYRVLVVPTVVIVDGKGKVVYSLPAYLQKSRDLLTDAILTSTGKLSPAQFEQSIDPDSHATTTQEGTKSDRLVHLGIELTRHGMYDIAEARFKEAAALVPGHLGAALGMGDLMLKQDRLPEAEQYYRSMLATAPDSQDALLGIATVQVRRGGTELTAAEATLKPIIDKNPKLPRARYLLGQIREQQGDFAAAMNEYKTATRLLLER